MHFSYFFKRKTCFGSLIEKMSSKCHLKFGEHESSRPRCAPQPPACTMSNSPNCQPLFRAAMIKSRIAQVQDTYHCQSLHRLYTRDPYEAELALTDLIIVKCPRAYLRYIAPIVTIIRIHYFNY